MRLSFLDPVGLPPFHRNGPLLEPEMQPAAVEVELQLARVPRLRRPREALFQGGSDMPHERRQVGHADIPRVGLHYQGQPIRDGIVYRVRLPQLKSENPQLPTPLY